MKHGWIIGTSSWIGPDSSAVEAIMEGGFDWKDYNFIEAETWTFARSASKTLDEINRQSFCVPHWLFLEETARLTQTLFHLEIIERTFQLSSLTLVGVYSVIKFSIHVITLKACMPFVTHRGPISIHPDFLPHPNMKGSRGKFFWQTAFGVFGSGSIHSDGFIEFPFTCSAALTFKCFLDLGSPSLSSHIAVV